MLLTAVLACVSGYTVATAADYTVATGEELVAAWNEAAASAEASAITITAPADDTPLTLTDEQRAQLNAVTGTGDITISMTDPNGTLSNFNYSVVNSQVQFANITLEEDGKDIVLSDAAATDAMGNNVTLLNDGTLTDDSALVATNNITIGNNAVITDNEVAPGVLNAEGDIILGEDTRVIGNASDLGVINVEEERYLFIGSGSILAENTSDATPGTIMAKANSEVVVFTNEDDATYIDGIATLTPNGDLTPATLSKLGEGALIYGADADSDTFGGKYVQYNGDLVIGQPVLDGTRTLQAATMGTDATTYDIQGGDVAVTAGSTLRGTTANFGENTMLYLADGATLDLANPATFAESARVGILVTDAEGLPVPTGLLPKGTETVNVALNGTDIANNLLNTPFITTTLTPQTGSGMTEISQQMLGLDTPMSGYAGNVYGVAKALEANRLSVNPDSAVANFYDDLMSVSTTDEAARIMQGISGEHVANFTWAATSTLNSFTDLGRIQSAASMLRHLPETVVITDAKGSPISRTTFASGSGNIWVGGFGVWDRQDARKGISGYSYDAGGYALGVDYKTSSGSLMGIAFGQGFGSFTDKGGFNADYDVDSYMGMFYGRIQPDRDSRFALDYFAAYGRSEFDGKSYLLGSPVHGSADTDTFSGAIYATWTQPWSYGKTLITPYTGIEFSTSELKSFSESGPDGRSFGNARAQNWTIPVGVTMARTYTTGSGTVVTPALTVAVTHDVSRINPGTTVSGPLGAWNARGVNVGRTALRVNAGIDMIFSNQWGMRVSYQFEARNKMTSHGINGSISYSF